MYGSIGCICEYDNHRTAISYRTVDRCGLVAARLDVARGHPAIYAIRLKASTNLVGHELVFRRVPYEYVSAHLKLFAKRWSWLRRQNRHDTPNAI